MAVQVSTIQVVGKLGNTVGYKRSGARRSGANFARVYAADVRDPKTAAQLYQRAIAATVAKGYAAMSAICDHSFQGKRRGAESMQYFYSVNLNKLRRDVERDLSDPVTDPVDMFGSVVAPRSGFSTVYAFKVSEGILTNSFLRVSSIDAQLCVLFPAAAAADETVSAYVRRCGLVRGDIFTALGLGVLDPQGAFASQFGQLASQPSTSFGFIRFKLKDAAFSDSSPVADAPVSQVFDIEYGGQATAFADDELPERAVFCDSITGGDDGFIGVIRSRRNSHLRSTCVLQGVLVDGTVSDESQYGIKSAYILNAWVEEQDTLGQSSLILEGGSLNGQQAPTPVPPSSVVPVAGSLHAELIDSEAFLVCNMSDRTKRIVHIGSGYPLAFNIEDNLGQFLPTPSPIPYGSTQLMPTDFEPFEFIDFSVQNPSTLQSIEAVISAKEWYWSEAEQRAGYVVTVLAGSVDLLGNSRVIAGDTYFEINISE